MDFELNEDQELLRRGLREILKRECPPQHVRAVFYEGDGLDRPLWETLARAGWTGVTVPEQNGGAGRPFEDLIVILEEAGRAVLPVPLTTTLLVARAIAGTPATPRQSEVLSGIASGRTSITIAIPEYGGDPGDTFTAAPSNDGFQISGRCSFVPHGPLADAVLLPAETTDASQALFLVPTDAPGISWTELGLMDRTVRHYAVELSSTHTTGLALATDAAALSPMSGA